jgi:hypothetical protein
MSGLYADQTNGPQGTLRATVSATTTLGQAGHHMKRITPVKSFLQDRPVCKLYRSGIYTLLRWRSGCADDERPDSVETPSSPQSDLHLASPLLVGDERTLGTKGIRGRRRAPAAGHPVNTDDASRERSGTTCTFYYYLSNIWTLPLRRAA